MTKSHDHATKWAEHRQSLGSTVNTIFSIWRAGAAYQRRTDVVLAASLRLEYGSRINPMVSDAPLLGQSHKTIGNHRKPSETIETIGKNNHRDQKP